MGRLDGKVALVTGGARGMGESHVRHFVAEGARVVFGDVLDVEGKAVADEIGAACLYVHHDVTSEDDWAAAVDAATSTYGKLDVLVNNAGILRFGMIAETTLAEFRQVLEVNLIGQWLGVRAVIEPMRAAGGGAIVNVSSIEGFIGAAGLSAYSASKFGVRGLTKAAARELGPHGIRVNSIHPGGIITPMVADAGPKMWAHVDVPAFLKQVPAQRFGQSPEISRLAVFLASDESSYCTGSEFVADGGMLTGAGY
jgi:3alpha(or 20beta)-hydroxysteroid dehydrogenase